MSSADGTVLASLATIEDSDAWNRFVAPHPEASVCHRYEWKAALEEAYSWRSYYLFLDSDQGWTGVLPMTHMRGGLARNRLISLPYLDRGGPLATSNESMERLKRSALRLSKEVGATGMELRGGVFEAQEGSKEATRFRFVLKLGNLDDLWKRIGPKVRNQIRKSEKEGLVTERVGVDKLDEFFRILARNMHRLGSPVHSRRFFRSIFVHLHEESDLYVTYDRDKQPVAAAVALRFRDEATVPWASANLEARSSCPNHSLYWKVLQDAAERGCRQFDFGRSSIGTGTYQFKKQWNAEPIPLIWTSYDPQGRRISDSSLSPQKHSLLVRLWSRLPETLATRLGPFIRRQLPN